MFVNILNQSGTRPTAANLRLGENNLLGQMLCRQIGLSSAEEADIDKHTIRIAEQQFGGAIDGTGSHLTPSLSCPTGMCRSSGLRVPHRQEALGSDQPTSALDFGPLTAGSSITRSDLPATVRAVA